MMFDLICGLGNAVCAIWDLQRGDGYLFVLNFGVAVWCFYDFLKVLR